MELNKWVENTLAAMTVEEKAGQLLMVYFRNLPEERADVIKSVLKYNLGGIFQPHTTQDTLASVVEDIQKNAVIPLLFSCDYESGSGWTIEGGVRFPRAMTRGNACDERLEYQIGSHIARQGRAIGSTLTFSPVIDLNTNHQNPDVNIRAYGEDAETVSRLSIQYIKGLQENGMLACVKHFPGNGGTDMDQHICPAVMRQSAEELKQTFLEPYRRCFKEADPAVVMVAHLEVPSLVTETNPENSRPVPTSASYEVITDLLRGELGFKGMVITDALNMGGITTHYNRGEAAVKAVKAGVDMLLVFDSDFELEYDAILDAVKRGEITTERLDDAVKNVLNAKVRAGIDRDRGLPSPYEIREDLFKPGIYDNISKEIIRKGITVLRNLNNDLPVKNIKGKKVAVLSTFNPDAETLSLQNQSLITMKDITPGLLRERGAIVDSYELTYHMENRENHDLVLKMEGYDYIFFNFFIIPNWGIGTLIPNKSALRMFMFGLLNIEKPVIITAFGSPYVMYYCPTAKNYICTYDETENAQKAAVNAWLGEAPVTGRSPVSLENIFKRGDGIDIIL